MQRFSSDHISRLKQIGLAFFEKIATDQTIAGENLDFYQGLLVGLDRAVKLIDEEDGARSLSLLEAKIATFIDTERDSFQQSSSSAPAPSGCNPSICRLPRSYIAQLRRIGTETNFKLDIKDGICPNETQDFYHGCIAALDFALSLAGEKYAYAQISLLKTNAAYFIDLNKHQKRQIHVSNMKGLPSLKRKDLYQKPGLIDAWVQVDNETQVGYSMDNVEQDDIDLLFIQEESLDSHALEEEDRESEDSNFDELTPSPHFKRQLLDLLDSNINLIDELEHNETSVKQQVEERIEEQTVSLEEEQRLETEFLLVGVLLDNYQKLKQGNLKVIKDWTAFLEDDQTIRVISNLSARIVLRVTQDGEVKSALSYSDADKLNATIKEKSQESDTSSTTLVSALYNLLEDDLSTDSVSSVAARNIQQKKLAESILPTAQRAFEYVLNHACEQVEETDEYTRVRLGHLYDLIVKEAKGISVSSLIASGRGELIKVRGEDLILAQGILSEDVEFWAVVAERLDRIDAMRGKPSRLPNDRADVHKSNDIEM